MGHGSPGTSNSLARGSAPPATQQDRAAWRGDASCMALFVRSPPVWLVLVPGVLEGTSVSGLDRSPPSPVPQFPHLRLPCQHAGLGGQVTQTSPGTHPSCPSSEPGSFCPRCPLMSPSVPSTPNWALASLLLGWGPAAVGVGSPCATRDCLVSHRAGWVTRVVPCSKTVCAVGEGSLGVPVEPPPRPAAPLCAGGLGEAWTPMAPGMEVPPCCRAPPAWHCRGTAREGGYPHVRAPVCPRSGHGSSGCAEVCSPRNSRGYF